MNFYSLFNSSTDEINFYNFLLNSMKNMTVDGGNGSFVRPPEFFIPLNLLNHTGKEANSTERLDTMTDAEYTFSVSLSSTRYWGALKPREKVGYVSLSLLVYIRNNEEAFQKISPQDNEKAALEQLNRNQCYFLKELDNDLSDQMLKIWAVLPDKRQRESLKLSLISLALEAYLDAEPQANYENMLDYAITLYENETSLREAPFLEKLRLYKLKANLNWINKETIDQLKNNPLETLKKVLLHNNHPFPKNDFWNVLSPLIVNLISQQNLRSLDEAALLWNRLQTGEMLKFDNHEGNGLIAVQKLRNTYVQALIPAWKKQKIIDNLFQQRMANSSEIYFDGFAIRNGQEKTFTQLVDSPELLSIPEYRILTPETRQSYLKEAFAQMGESTQYKLGSLAHSLASALIRLFYYQTHRMPPLFSDQQQLIHLFMEAEKAWKEKKNFPIHPRILAALHLALSNDVMIEGKNWQEKVKFLLHYIASEFEYILHPDRVEQLIPTFDPRLAAESILKEYGMKEADIFNKRPSYRLVVANSDTAHEGILAQIAEVPLDSDDAIDEFLKKARANDEQQSVNNWMSVGNATIEPREELQKKLIQFNNRLMSNPWIRENARIVLEAQGIPVTPTRLSEEVERLATQYKTETENHQQWFDKVKLFIYVIPVIGSLETIREGLKNRDWKTILLGSVYLTLDAAGLGFVKNAVRGVNSLRLASVLSATRISVRERMAVSSLENSLVAFDIPPRELFKEEPGVISRNLFALNPEEQVINRVRQGEERIVENSSGESNLLIYLHDENRVVAVKNQGGYFREVNWESGKVDLTRPLIYKDRETGKYFASTLKGGGLGHYDFFIEPIPEGELKKRWTVEQTLQALAEAKDFRNHANFSEKFHHYFTLKGVHPDEGKTIGDICEHSYKNSPTFRRLFNKFTSTYKVGVSDWQIKIEKGQGCRTDFQNRIVYLDPQVEQSSSKYLSANYLTTPDYEGEKIQLERAVVQEIVRVMTRLEDAESTLLATSKRRFALLDKAHRGGVVYLTDRILFEAYDPTPARLANHLFAKGDIVNAETLLSRLVQEDLFLDSQLDKDIPISQYTKLAGEEWISRNTIQQVKRLLPLLEAARVSEEFSTRFLVSFFSEDPLLFDELNQFYTTMYNESKTFSLLFDQYSGREILPIRVKFIEVKRDIPLKEQDHAVYLVKDNIQYLSALGPRPIERRRLFLYKMLEVLTGLKLGESEQLADRHPLIQLADKIFREANMEQYFPKRLTSTNILPDEAAELKNQLSHWPEQSRIANFEDRFLDEEIYTQKRGCFLSCARAERVRREDEQAGSLKQTLEEIKAANGALLSPREGFYKSSSSTVKSPGFFKKALIGSLTILLATNHLR